MDRALARVSSRWRHSFGRVARSFILRIAAQENQRRDRGNILREKITVPKCDENEFKIEEYENENHPKPETSDCSIAEGRQGRDVSRERPRSTLAEIEQALPPRNDLSLPPPLLEALRTPLSLVMRQCTQNIELESNNLSCKEHGAVLNEHC
jgi:hypothetical protein